MASRGYPTSEPSVAPRGNDSRSRRRLSFFVVPISLSLLVLLLTQETFLQFAPLKRLELASIDARFRFRGPIDVPQESLDVIIVDISEESFKSLPHRYPWPRSYYARAARNLHRAGARAIGFDIVFDQADASDSANDLDFRSAILQTRIIALAAKTEIQTQRYSVRSEHHNYGNIFFGADSAIGIVYVPNDDEGIYRRYRPFTYDAFTERTIPQLSFAVLNKYFSLPPFEVVENSPDAFGYRGRSIPKADDVSFLINYYGPDRTFRHIPFADVIDDQEFTTTEEAEVGEGINLFDDPDIGYLAAGMFKDKIVLIGSTMPEDKDLFPVPVSSSQVGGGNLMYGVEIHANVIQNVLDGKFLRREPWWLDALAVVALTTLTFVAVTRFKAIKFTRQSVGDILSAGLTIAALASVVGLSLFLFASFDYVMTVTSPLLSIVVGYGGGIIQNYLTERKQKAFMKSMFTQYLNPNVVNDLVNHPEKLRLGGERREMTIFFSDIKGFTSLSEKLQPEELVALLNEYLSAMTDIIFRHEGTLDKFEGDAVMAFWGAPMVQPDHALRACTASLEMQEKLKQIRVEWKAQGKPDIHVRIGLNTGVVLVGNMGGEQRFDYTVMGDHVNLASRLEGANKQYHTSIMLGENTFKAVEGKVIARELDRIQVVGKAAPVTVYELRGLISGAIPPDEAKFLDLYARGIENHRKWNWEEAIRLFEQAMTIVKEDYPSQIYIERSKIYQMSPPPDDWNGVFVLRSK